MLTKKDFQSTAENLGQLTLTEDEILKLANQYADLFEENNPRFNRDRFIAEVERQMSRARYEEKKRLGAVAVALRPQFLEEA